MKKATQLMSIALVSLLLNSCGGGESLSEVNLIPVRNGSDFQYIDQEGKIVINPQFRDATVFRNGLALVRTTGDSPKWGFIDKEGKFVINATFLEATVFSDDLAWVVSENAAPSAINNKGEIKMTLTDAKKVSIFKEGLAAFCINDSTGIKWGFVNKEGKISINPQFYNARNFSQEMCAVQNGEGKWGFIDKEGKIIINYQFDSAKEFSQGKAIVAVENKTGLIDKNGKYIINPQYSYMIDDGDSYLIEQDRKWGWCDQEGKILVNPQFSAAAPFFGNKLAAVRSGDSYGYIDRDGKIIINPQFEIALPFNGNLALVRSGRKFGFIDKDGKYIINPQFDDVAKDFGMFLSNGSSSYEMVQTNYLDPMIEIMEKRAQFIQDSIADRATFLQDSIANAISQSMNDR